MYTWRQGAHGFLACLFLVVLMGPMRSSGVLAGQAPPGQAADGARSGQKWNFIRGSCDSDAGTARLLGMLKDSKQAGCTHILLAESNMSRVPDQKPAYFRNVRKVLDAARDMNLVIVPYLMHMGYSGRYLRDDGNLAAGLPVKDMLFVVKGDIAIPDPSAAVSTAGLKESKGHLVGKIEVKPFHHYRVSYYTKQKPNDLDEYLQVTSPGRSHCRMFPSVAQDGESFFVQVTFNSLDARNLTFDLATTSVRNLRIEPAGLLLVVRRPLVPLTVASEDGRTVYREGEDFRPIADPLIDEKPFRGEISISHAPAVIELTPNSRIRSGQKLRVSFWHAYRIRNDQVSISLTDPRFLEILEEEFRTASKAWPTGHYALDYEEMRLAGWEPQPHGEDLKPGAVLARLFKKTYDIARRHAPGAVLYTWSDMFCPGHNARPFEVGGYYYLVNGNWDGSWEGVPKDVVILNWYSPTDKNVKFFADRGHRQVLGVFADGKDTAGLKKTIQGFADASRGSPNILGWMYITYADDWSKVKEVFRLVETFGDWGRSSAAPAAGGPVAKPPGETD